MEQFNRNTYKKQTVWQEFSHSCLGRVLMLVAVGGVFSLIAVMTRPTVSMMRWQTMDNIHECLQASDSITNDAIDDYVGNLGRVFTHADTAQTDREQWKTFQSLNRLEIYSHPLYRTAYIHNNIHTDGVRVGIGLFGVVIPTIKYGDMLLNTGTVRGEYFEEKIQKTTVPEEYIGENPNVQPYHYRNNPDD